MKKTRCSLPLILLICLPHLVQAQHQQAHVHGLATLSLAIENTVLEIELESPAANLLGFEHVAQSPAEKQRVKQMESILNQPGQLFVFTGSSCEVTDISLDIESATGHEDDSHGEPDDHEPHHHDHNHHNAHDHESHADAIHSDIKAYYQFNCENAAAIRSVSTTLFEHFPAIEKVNTLWATPAGQGVATLNANRAVITLP